jgi:hypothetical protein
MAYLFLGHSMAAEQKEFSQPPPRVRETYGPAFECKYCRQRNLRWWRNDDDRPLPLNEYGEVHNCRGGKRDGD